MVLHPLEFSECFLDSPWFRTSIKEYEDELERTNSQIKQLIKDAKAMLQASRKQGETMQVFSERLKRFQFEIIGENLTDAERGIAGSLKEFGTMLQEIEGEWTRTIERSELQLIQPLENFRKEHIHSYREAKKGFDKKSERYYKQMEQTLNLSHKKKSSMLEESDNELVQYKKAFHQTSLNYVYKLQEVQERKKFEFVEHLLMFMQVYFNFFHQTHETATDCKDYMKDIQMLLVETRSQYEGTRDITQTLMRRMMDNPLSSSKDDDQNSSPNRVIGQRWARAGYLLVLDKSPLGGRFAAKWSRYFCMYTKANKLFQMISPASQSSSSSSASSARIGSINHHGSVPTAADPHIVLSCTRKARESIDKRFCFDIEVEDSAGKQTTYTLQATSIVDRKKWIAAMDGKEPNYISKHEYKKPEEFSLNKTSIKFVNDVIEEIERRGVDAEGIYRLVGVSSKVDRLLQIAMDSDIYGSLNYKDEIEWELNTLTSALKNFFRNLPEPIMTFDLHEDFIQAAKQEDPDERLRRVISFVAKLSPDSRHVLERLIRHLVKVSSMCEVNKMTVQNIGVCFGPTLMRPKQETVQSIMEIKFNNIIVEILIENYSAIFGDHESQNGQQRKVTSPKPTAINSRPSIRLRGKLRAPRTTGKRLVDPYLKQPLPSTDQETNARFQRGHAIRGVPGRPVSPRMQQRISTAKAGSDNEEESLSSSDYNTDEFGRISPLDLNIDLEHFSVEKSPRQGRTNPQHKTQSTRSSTEEPVVKENWSIDRRSATKKGDSNTGKGIKRGTGLTQSERMHSPPRHSLNQNNSNHTSQRSTSPSVQMRKRQLLSHSKQNQNHPPVPEKSDLVRKVQHTYETLKSTESIRNNEKRDTKDRPSSIDFDKLKEKFSQNEQKTSDKSQADEDSMSFLWPKPGSIKANSYVESENPAEQRPRSTVVSSRQAIIRLSDSSPSSPIKDDVTKKKDVFVTLYACEAEHETELSFVPDEIVHDVRTSEEPGWLVGTINGNTGLIPENYVRKKIWQ